MDRVNLEIELRETLDGLARNALADFLAEGFGGYSAQSLKKDPKLFDMVYEAFSEQLLDYEGAKVASLLSLAISKYPVSPRVRSVASRPATNPALEKLDDSRISS